MNLIRRLWQWFRPRPTKGQQLLGIGNTISAGRKRT